MKKVFGLAALGTLLTAIFVLAAQPVRAENMDTRISALEQELARLKGEQTEMREEAAAAKSKQPGFRYRQRSGLRIRAADRSWEVRFGYRFHGRLAFWPDGQRDHDGNRTNGEYFGRRNRLSFDYRWNKGLYQLYFQGDFDSGGDTFEIQRSTFNVYLNRLNPLLPRFVIGMDGPGLYNWHDSNFGSSTSGHLERSMLVRSTFGINTGGSQQGWGFLWNRVRIGQGDATMHFSVMHAAGVGNGLGTDSNSKDYNLFVGGRPLSKSKSKWAKGIDFGVGFYFGTNDPKANRDGNNRIRIRDHRMVAEDGGGSSNRIELFRTTVGAGDKLYVTPGFGWRIGPYRLRTAMGFASAEDKNDPGKKRGRMWSIAHELFVWSPKGFLTGNANGPNSVMVSWLFEHNDASCGEPGCASGGEYSRNVVLLRELDIWYFVQRNISVGFSWLWYDAKNVRTRDQFNLGCVSRGGSRPGKGCNWHNFILALRVGF